MQYKNLRWLNLDDDKMNEIGRLAIQRTELDDRSLNSAVDSNHRMCVLGVLVITWTLKSLRPRCSCDATLVRRKTFTWCSLRTIEVAQMHICLMVFLWVFFHKCCILSRGQLHRNRRQQFRLPWSLDLFLYYLFNDDMWDQSLSQGRRKTKIWYVIQVAS